MAAADTSKSPVHILERTVAASFIGGPLTSAQPPITGVAVNAAAIHAALIDLGLITA
jgi:hypothetical protein